MHLDKLAQALTDTLGDIWVHRINTGRDAPTSWSRFLDNAGTLARHLGLQPQVYAWPDGITWSFL